MNRVLQPVTIAELLTATATLYNKGDDTIIGGRRNNHDVKNTNDVAIHAPSGAVVVSDQPADNAMVGDQDTEEYVWLFEFTWTGGGADAHEARVTLSNIHMKS